MTLRYEKSSRQTSSMERREAALLNEPSDLSSSSPSSSSFSSSLKQVGGFTPHNSMAGERVLFLANFHSNDVTLSQLQVRKNKNEEAPVP